MINLNGVSVNRQTKYIFLITIALTMTTISIKPIKDSNFLSNKIAKLTIVASR